MINNLPKRAISYFLPINIYVDLIYHYCYCYEHLHTRTMDMYMYATISFKPISRSGYRLHTLIFTNMSDWQTTKSGVYHQYNLQFHEEVEI